MKILSVEPHLLSYAFPEPIRMPFYGGLRTNFKRDAMLIRITAEGGLTGYGPGPGSDRAQSVIQSQIGPFLTGRDCRNPEALRSAFESEVNPDSGVRKLYGGVELALYDLAGKANGVPASELLGGRVRDRIKLYGSAGMYQSPEGYAAEAAAIVGMGFPAYKMRPAAGPDADVETVRQMRRAMGEGPGLMVDAHAWWRMGDRSYSWNTVRDVAKEMAAYGMTWLEEPLPPEDHDAYRKLRAEGIVPLASGEHEQSEESFQDLIRTGCVEYVQADLICQGGYPLAQRLFASLAPEGLRFAFHSWGNDLEVMAAAHLGICWEENPIEWLEYPCYSNNGRPGMYPFPLAQEILKEPLEIADGYLRVSDKPGFGVDVDESVIGRYRWIPGPWSEFRLESPPETLAVTGDHSIRWVEKG